MFPDELEDAFAQRPLLYLPYGICEPHGPQCAVGLDALKAHGIACAAARAHGGIVAPVDYWHIHEIGGYAPWAVRNVGEVARTWLSSAPPWVHFRNVCYQIRAADAIGFHAVILLTGHYGPNWRDLKTLVDLVQPRVGARLFGLPDSEANHRGFASDGQSGGDHAGRVETSLLWALEPECVDMSRIGPDDGVGSFAMGATARESDRRIGERMVADEAGWLHEKADELLAAYQRDQPTQRLRTFADVERLWAEVVAPALPDFQTMEQFWGDPDDPANQVPADSRWHPNWEISGAWGP